MIKLYTWPDCPNCKRLKAWLVQQNIEFVAQSFTVVVQTDFIMQDIFGSPPILQVSSGILVGEDMFEGHDLQEQPIRRLISDNTR